MNWIAKNALYLAWIIALVAMIGSLYFQYVLGFAPCSLCWYQRVAMYPLAFIIPVSIAKKDANVLLYVLPLAMVGAVVALYHTLLNYGVIAESLAPCSQGVSCVTTYINWLGFVNIPLLSLGSFIAIIVLILIRRKFKN